ncbi:hypothetical protein EMIT0111MI5_10523 [Burkholderia sp. IT-111MI5]
MGRLAERRVHRAQRRARRRCGNAAGLSRRAVQGRAAEAAGRLGEDPAESGRGAACSRHGVAADAERVGYVAQRLARRAGRDGVCRRVVARYPAAGQLSGDVKQPEAPRVSRAALPVMRRREDCIASRLVHLFLDAPGLSRPLIFIGPSAPAMSSAR